MRCHPLPRGSAARPSPECDPCRRTSSESPRRLIHRDARNAPPQPPSSGAATGRRWPYSGGSNSGAPEIPLEPAPNPRSFAHLRSHKSSRVVLVYILRLFRASFDDLHLALRQFLPHGDAIRNANQVGILEFHARPFVAIVQ